MSKKKSYDEVSVIRALSRKKSIKIDMATKHVKVAKDAMDVGNGSWGKIDYLCHYCGYVQTFTASVPMIRKEEDGVSNETKRTKTKRVAAPKLEFSDNFKVGKRHASI